MQTLEKNEDFSSQNNEGRLIHPTASGVENFWSWFGNSRATDKNGNPMVVYHGTIDDFEVFSKAEGGKNIANDSGKQGFFFTDSPALAAQYAQMRFGDEKLMPVYLSLDKAKVSSLDHIDVLDYRVSIGHFPNGAIIKVGTGDNIATIYIAKHPNQIKSAIGNCGSFDPNEDNILL